jgi:hypothetical protein
MTLHSEQAALPDQETLAAHQVSAFYHDEFVTDQVRDFGRLVGRCELLADLGGGVGHFAKASQGLLADRVLVIDSDPISVQRCADEGVHAIQDDAIFTRAADAADVVAFNLILHHLVGRGSRATRDLQVTAMRNQTVGGNRRLFVNEYIYESYLARDFAGLLIFTITSSRLLSAVAGFVARFVPSLQANTFGVGVRFRSAADWCELFAEAGWEVEGQMVGQPELISGARRFAFALKSCRRDSFILRRLTSA